MATATAWKDHAQELRDLILAELGYEELYRLQGLHERGRLAPRRRRNTLGWLGRDINVLIQSIRRQQYLVRRYLFDVSVTHPFFTRWNGQQAYVDWRGPQSSLCGRYFAFRLPIHERIAVIDLEENKQYTITSQSGQRNDILTLTLSPTTLLFITREAWLHAIKLADLPALAQPDTIVTNSSLEHYAINGVEQFRRRNCGRLASSYSAADEKCTAFLIQGDIIGVWNYVDNTLQRVVINQNQRTYIGLGMGSGVIYVFKLEQVCSMLRLIVEEYSGHPRFILSRSSTIYNIPLANFCRENSPPLAGWSLKVHGTGDANIWQLVVPPNNALGLQSPSPISHSLFVRVAPQAAVITGMPDNARVWKATIFVLGSDHLSIYRLEGDQIGMRLGRAVLCKDRAVLNGEHEREVFVNEDYLVSFEFHSENRPGFGPQLGPTIARVVSSNYSVFGRDTKIHKSRGLRLLQKELYLERLCAVDDTLKPISI